MIKVNIIADNNIVSEIMITGHASYDEYGKDIVCASVSSIVITTVNGILNIYPKSIDYNQDDDMLKIHVNESNDIINKLLINMLELLKELEKDYSKYIKIINKEV